MANKAFMWDGDSWEPIGSQITTSSTFQAATASEVPLTLKGATSQTADLFKIQNSASNNLVQVDSTGNVGINVAPAKTLDVRGTIRAAANSTSGYSLFEYGVSSTATNNWHAGSEGDGTFRFYNGTMGAGTERMRIDSAGRVTTPAQPAFSAVNTAATTQGNYFAFGTEVMDRNGNFDPATGRFTAPVAGYYFFHVSVLITQAPTGEHRVELYKNGSFIANASGNIDQKSSGWWSMKGSWLVSLAANDWIAVWYQAGGTAHTDANFSRFFGWLVG